MVLMGALWLIITLAAPTAVTVTLPLLLLALFALWAAGWKTDR
jgi:hypothetical protein